MRQLINLGLVILVAAIASLFLGSAGAGAQERS